MNESSSQGLDDVRENPLPEAAGNGSPAVKSPSNLAVRLLTTAVLGPLLLVLLFYGPAWGWAVFICLSSVQVAREMLAMSHPEDTVSQWVGALSAGAITGMTYLAKDDPRLFMTGVILSLFLSALLSLVRLGQIETAALRLLGGMSGPLYIGVMLASLALLRSQDHGSQYVLLTLFIAWMGDTGGYVFGRLFGKTKLYPAVSPKKTREGLLGSVVFSTVSSGATSLLWLDSLPLVHALFLGAVGAVLGTAGDLVESLLKRSTGVKDSGSILPGHGGLFDRVDALVVVGPFVYLYTLWL